jgi:hypothetical protein
MAPFTLLVVVGGTATLVAIGAADRNAGAYGEYFEQAEVGDLVINPATYTREVDQLIRALPGVERVTSWAFFNTTFDDGTPRPMSEVDSPTGPAVFVYGSLDGRSTEMDRPALRAGRLPTGTGEAIVSTDLADAEGIEVGDVVPVSFWHPTSDLLPRGLPTERGEDPIVEPIGVERLEVAGIGTFSNEVLPDGLYPRGRVIVSRDVAARYACFPSVPPPGLSIDKLTNWLLPPDCARSYQYFSLDLADDAAGIPAALDAFLQGTLDQNVAWYEAYGEDAPTYFLIPFANWRERARVERSIRPTVTALGILSAAIAAVTVALAGLAVARELRRSRVDQRHWWRLGMTASARAAVVAAPMLAAVAAGITVSMALAWLLSPIAPTGAVRSVDPSPDRELTIPVIIGTVALIASLGAGIVLLSIRAARLAGRIGSSPRPLRATPRWIESAASPAFTDGLRAASRMRSLLLVASTAVGTAVVVAAVVFGASLSGLVSTPEHYGWNWDVAAMTGFGYGDLDLEAASETLDGNQDVESFTILGFVNEVTINGEAAMAVVALDRQSDIEFTLLDGRLPTAAGEVALGAKTASSYGVGLGDEVVLGGRRSAQSEETVRATVTGIVVFPALGPFESDRVATGTGMLLSEAMIEPAAVSDIATFVGVDLVDEASKNDVRSDLLVQMRRWDTLAPPAIEYADPVRPPEIIDARSMRAVPVFIASVGAIAIGIGLAFALWASVRSRQRDLGILRALGFSGPQVRRSVRVQALVTMLAALIVGVPIGIFAGRSAWRAFANELGVVPDPAGALAWIAAIIGVALIIAVLAAAIPAHLAARSTPAAALRAE